MKAFRLLLLAVLCLGAGGCGTFVAHSIVRSPNRYPSWFDAEAPVMLAFNPKMLTNFAAKYVDVGPPPARLCYRIIEPADYHFHVSSTNWVENGEKQYEFHFKASLPGETNVWTAAPRGTVILLHGYGVAQFSMMPWAFLLAEDGWRCVLVDLRGHGDSTGKRIYFTVEETNDMNQLLDALAQKKELIKPVAAMGESYGGVLALRWKTVNPAIDSVVAIAPYASLSNVVLNIRGEYAGLIPKFMVKEGIKKLPSLLQIQAIEFDTTTVLKRHPVKALFIAGGDDQISGVQEVEKVRALASPGSQLIVVPEATHEALTYYFKDLVPAVLPWLDGDSKEHNGKN
jgi:pimeloyl-ACP methyl ester carboxylesterase